MHIFNLFLVLSLMDRLMFVLREKITIVKFGSGKKFCIPYNSFRNILQLSD